MKAFATTVFTHLALLLSVPFTLTAKADASTAKSELSLPSSIIETLEISARQGTCEPAWQEIAAGVGVIHDQLDETTKLYLVPCAHWAHNMAWQAFVTIVEPSNPNGFITLTQHFVDYSPYEGLTARDIVHNIEWDADEQVLRARFYLNGKEQCGTIGEYKWNADQRGLLLQSLHRQDHCDGKLAPWVTVYQAQGAATSERGKPSETTALRKNQTAEN